MLTYGCNVEVTEMHGVDVVKGHIVYSIEFPKGSEVNNGEPFREPIVSEERRPSTVERWIYYTQKAVELVWFDALDDDGCVVGTNTGTRWDPRRQVAPGEGLRI